MVRKILVVSSIFIFVLGAQGAALNICALEVLDSYGFKGEFSNQEQIVCLNAHKDFNDAQKV